MSVKHFYLEPSAMFKSYHPEKGTDVMNYLFENLKTGKVIGVTSYWSLTEILRAFTKLRNLGNKISDIVIDSTLADIDHFVLYDQIRLIPAGNDLIDRSMEFIRYKNFTTADALHLSTAIDVNVDYLITSDEKFKKQDYVNVFDPTLDNALDVMMEILE